MRIILIYDVGEKRVGKVLKICREYLTWIQNSVFEGDITDSDYFELISRIKQTIDLDSDSVVVYHLWTTKYKREVIGVEKANLDNII